MSSIDNYKHKLIGFINCPSDYSLISGRNNNNVAIYLIEENIPSDESMFDGKKGDILIGGGSGEVKSLRVSIPEMIQFEYDELSDFDEINELRKSFWNSNEAYIYCNGYSKLGWKPEVSIEHWLAENTIKYLIFKNQLESDIEISGNEICPGLFVDSTYIKIMITRFVDFHQPDIIEFSFTDYKNQIHKFIDKIPIITNQELDENSEYPIEECILIDILNKEDENEEVLYSFRFKESYGLESTNGESIFKIGKEQIIIR